jgi:hypothetical protein
VGGESIGMEQVGSVQPGASSKFKETSSPDLPEWASFDYVIQSSTDAAPDPALTPSVHPAGPPQTSLNCNPTMTLSTHKVVVGQAVTVNVAGTPGSTVTLEGYSRPSTTYGAIRGGVQLDSAGRSAPFSVKPATNARVRLQVVGCSTPGTGQVITVTPVLTIAASRVRTRTWTFSGKMLPSVQNTGRAITLYYKPSTGSPVRKGIAYVAKDGTYRVTLAFTSTKTLQFYFATGSNQTNNAASSNVRTLTTY